MTINENRPPSSMHAKKRLHINPKQEWANVCFSHLLGQEGWSVTDQKVQTWTSAILQSKNVSVSKNVGCFIAVVSIVVLFILLLEVGTIPTQSRLFSFSFGLKPNPIISLYYLKCFIDLIYFLNCIIHFYFDARKIYFIVT